VKIDTQTRTIQLRNFDFHYSEEDFVNPGSYDFHRHVWSNREPLAYVIHTCGAVLAIVFPEYYAYTEQDAIDEAVDKGKLDSLLISQDELKDYESGTFAANRTSPGLAVIAVFVALDCDTDPPALRLACSRPSQFLP
jgi:hypothetical protein